jgi:hypothetical protein
MEFECPRRRHHSGQERGPRGRKACQMRELPNTWIDGNVRQIHQGFAVCKIVGKFSKPMEMASKVYETAQTALLAAEKLGPDFAAFRVHKSGSELRPFERIQRQDLPIVVSSSPRR